MIIKLRRPDGSFVLTSNWSAQETVNSYGTRNTRIQYNGDCQITLGADLDALAIHIALQSTTTKVVDLTNFHG